jgi:hypothetical protein
MDPSKLKSGETYNFNEPCTGVTELVKFSHETINHYIFESDTVKKWLCHDNVKSNISEIPI